MFKTVFLVNNYAMKTRILLFIFSILLLLFGVVRKYSNPINAFLLKENPAEEYVYAYSNFGLENYYSCGELKILYGKNIIQKVDFSKKEALGAGLVFSQLNIKEFEKLNNLKLVSIEQANGIDIYNYYSFNLPKYIILKNQRVNIQVAVSEEQVKVGYPLILDSF